VAVQTTTTNASNSSRPPGRRRIQKSNILLRAERLGAKRLVWRKRLARHLELAVFANSPTPPVLTEAAMSAEDVPRTSSFAPAAKRRRRRRARHNAGASSTSTRIDKIARKGENPVRSPGDGAIGEARAASLPQKSIVRHVSQRSRPRAVRKHPQQEFNPESTRTNNPVHLRRRFFGRHRRQLSSRPHVERVEWAFLGAEVSKKDDKSSARCWRRFSA